MVSFHEFLRSRIFCQNFIIIRRCADYETAIFISWPSKKKIQFEVLTKAVPRRQEENISYVHGKFNTVSAEPLKTYLGLTICPKFT